MGTEAIVPILQAFETGSAKGDYGLVSLLHDGDGGRLQVTLGIGFTENGGDLKAVLERYMATASATKPKEVATYIGLINNPFTPYATLLAENKGFQSLLKSLGSDPAMQAAQDLQFEIETLAPARRWAVKNGFTFPLSELVISDSFLQSGTIFMFLRNRFLEPVPVNQGNEKEWICQYVHVRDLWLRSGSPAMRASAYRTEFLSGRIIYNDWKLSKGRYNVNGVIVDVPTVSN